MQVDVAVALSRSRNQVLPLTHGGLDVYAETTIPSVPSKLFE